MTTMGRRAFAAAVGGAVAALAGVAVAAPRRQTHTPDMLAFMALSTKPSYFYFANGSLVAHMPTEHCHPATSARLLHHDTSTYEVTLHSYRPELLDALGDDVELQIVEGTTGRAMRGRGNVRAAPLGGHVWVGELKLCVRPL